MTKVIFPSVFSLSRVTLDRVAGVGRVGLQLGRKEEEGAQSVDAILLQTKRRVETANSLAITFKKSIAC